MPARRAHRMDQDIYPCSPIVTRRALKWPDNSCVALAVIVDLEHWHWEGSSRYPAAREPHGRLGGPVDRQSVGISQYRCPDTGRITRARWVCSASQ